MVKTIKTKRLPKDPGPAGWNEIYKDKSSFPAVDTDIEVDWVVIGGGFAGLGAAKRLLQLLGSKERIAVIEARGIAQGPAGRNSGFMLDLPHELNSDTYVGSKEQDLRQIRLNREAITMAESIAHQYGMDKALFSRSGKITASATERGYRSIETYAKHLTALDEPYELLGADELYSLLGTQFYTKGLRTAKTAMIQPAGYIHSAYKGLALEGVQVYECSPVVEMKLNDSVHTLICANGSVRAKNVIMAVNGHIQSFGFFKQSLLHIFTYSSMTRAS
ncbi:NAD(P)/FAD-dependent oxidoreductase [Marinomonas rhodophyticola]|uniref:FAD-binding oxidoreductase n=1 Tax=Marinomonas rhodophyticola TaxID=2992803 RepID=A0ABT3KH04_9GAMM|nr:FAD-binding oxidoreductase [Marinomonas sp. KJ51-3]MCW4629795.1 FAD-binding oxidoreductase [Marinomonas sp. KJ51-3]